MKTQKFKNKPKTWKQNKSVETKLTNSADSRYEYLMLLNSDWIATQNNNSDFVRSIS